ncbi:MAG TPA: TlpA disulfide reductase family protein [Solirubrobacterales bacterium]
MTLLVALLLAVGCGSEGGDFDGSHPDYEKALAGAPAPLAAIHRQGNELLPGGNDAYEKRIADLHGYPIVVNVWASWCGPCKFEFPALQELSAEYGKRVAFLGINSEDSDGFAKSFLEDAPVPFPSYTDPDKDIAEQLGATGFPDTAYYGRDGELCFLKIGQYAEHSEMRADLERHALAEEGCEGA